MPDDTEKLLADIRDLLRTSTDVALRNEHRIEKNLEAQRRLIAKFGVFAFLIIAALGVFALWILYQIAIGQDFFKATHP